MTQAVLSQPLPLVRRYLWALSSLTTTQDPEVRTWARQCLRDMATPGVGVLDYLKPLMTRPLASLSHPERWARRLAG